MDVGADSAAARQHTPRKRGERRVSWAVRVYPSVFDKADEVLALPRVRETTRSQLFRRYIAEGISRDLRLGG